MAAHCFRCHLIGPMEEHALVETVSQLVPYEFESARHASVLRGLPISKLYLLVAEVQPMLQLSELCTCCYQSPDIPVHATRYGREKPSPVRARSPKDRNRKPSRPLLLVCRKRKARPKDHRRAKKTSLPQENVQRVPHFLQTKSLAMNTRINVAMCITAFHHLW